MSKKFLLSETSAQLFWFPFVRSFKLITYFFWLKWSRLSSRPSYTESWTTYKESHYRKQERRPRFGQFWGFSSQESRIECLAIRCFEQRWTGCHFECWRWKRRFFLWCLKSRQRSWSLTRSESGRLVCGVAKISQDQARSAATITWFGQLADQLEAVSPWSWIQRNFHFDQQSCTKRSQECSYYGKPLPRAWKASLPKLSSTPGRAEDKPAKPVYPSPRQAEKCTCSGNCKDLKSAAAISGIRVC